jgi:hypothetical protein
MDTLGSALPEAGKVIAETRERQVGMELPHVEMGDLARWFISTFRTAEREGQGSRSAQVVSQFLCTLEASFRTGDQSMDDLIGTSFLENLHQAGDDLRAIRSMLSPKMAKWYEEAMGD